MTGLQGMVQSVMSNIYPREGYSLPTGGKWVTDEYGHTVFDNTQNVGSNTALNTKRSYTGLAVAVILLYFLLRR